MRISVDGVTMDLRTRMQVRHAAVQGLARVFQAIMVDDTLSGLAGTDCQASIDKFFVEVESEIQDAAAKMTVGLSDL